MGMRTLAELSEYFRSQEGYSGLVLPRETFAVLRLDGVNFSSLTRRLAKPFSAPFEEAMNAAALAVVKQALPDALVVYVASDEISVVLAPREWDYPHAGKQAKIFTIAASAAATAFTRSIESETSTPGLFDCRVTLIPSLFELQDYFTWRRMDTRKNAISMAAEVVVGAKKLHGISTAQRAAMLVGTPFELIPEGTFNGRIAHFKSGAEGEVLVPATQEHTHRVLTRMAVERIPERMAELEARRKSS